MLHSTGEQLIFLTLFTKWLFYFFFFLFVIIVLDTVSVTMSHWNCRSSHWRCSVKIGVVKNFGKFTRKHLCQSLFFNKVAGLRHRRFPVNSAKFLRTPFLIEHLCWLLMFFVRNVTCKVYEEHLPDFESSHLPLL